MNLFEEIDEDLFRPLTGINKRKYIDLLALVRDKCKRMPMYAIEKSTVFDMAKAGDCSSAFCYVMRATISEARQGRCIAPRRGFYHIRNMAIKGNESSILLRGLLDSMRYTIYL